jgi:hypothetical protein
MASDMQQPKTPGRAVNFEHQIGLQPGLPNTETRLVA